MPDDFKVEVLKRRITETVRYCTFHGRIASRKLDKRIEEDWCSFEYRHECRGNVVKATLTYVEESE